MALVVETGSASASSEAYASVADADSYFSLRGFALWAGMSTAEKEQALRRATGYMLQTYRLRWSGFRVADTQALDWPRYGVERPDSAGSLQGAQGVFNVGAWGGPVYYDHLTVPREVREANIELAYKAAAGELLADVDPEVASESVGPVAVSYFQGSSKTKKYPAIDRLLMPMLNGYGTIGLVRA